jgi:hypothetical protein
MNYNNIGHLKEAGFLGFKSIREVMEDCSEIPAIKGIYLILNVDKAIPSYLEIGTGGHFKSKNPNVAIERLRQNWVDDTIILYIGKAGGDNGGATLRSRLKQYFGFGQGRNIGHWGGRFIWQLSTSRNLLVCWKPLPQDDPRAEERKLIADFMAQFGKRPFANLSS